MYADLTAVGRALSTPARSRMVSLLLDGTEHSAGELRGAAGVASGTASEHLAVLVASGLVTVRRSGRHRWYALADERVAQALEALSPPPNLARPLGYRLSAEQRRIREARTCYDHLAGRLGCTVTQAFVDQGWVEPGLEEITETGASALRDRGVELDDLLAGRRRSVRPCLDWTERSPHVAGALGAGLARHALFHGWVARLRGSRGLLVTPHGRSGLAGWGVSLLPLDEAPNPADGAPLRRGDGDDPTGSAMRRG